MTTESLNDCSTYSHHPWYSPCAYLMTEAQCLIPYICLFSKPQLRAAPQRYRHGVTYHLRPSRVGRVPHHCMQLLPSCANSPAAEILQAICHQFCHTALYKEIYLWSRSCCTQCLRIFQVVLLSRIRTSVTGKYGSKVFQQADPFLVNSRTGTNDKRTI